jgi:hypothetical protein
LAVSIFASMLATTRDASSVISSSDCSTTLHRRAAANTASQARESKLESLAAGVAGEPAFSLGLSRRSTALAAEATPLASAARRHHRRARVSTSPWSSLSPDATAEIPAPSASQIMVMQEWRISSR